MTPAALVALLAALAGGLAQESTPGLPIQEGAWGRLELTPVRIRVPREMVPEQPLALPPWNFGTADRPRIEAELRRAGLSAGAVAGLMATASEGEPRLHPTARQRLELGAEARQRLYAVLAREEPNTHQRYPTRLPREGFARRFATLSPQTRELLTAFLYARESAPGSWLLADLPALTHLVTDPAERLRLVQAVSLRESLLLRLHVDAASDVAALTRWWGRGGRRRDIETLLASIQDVDGGYDLDALLLLPPLVRALAYSYPAPEVAATRDCFWTAVGFFDPPGAGPDDARIEAELHRLQRVSGPLQLGDVLLLASGGELVHAAVYIADDVYFTKNGGHFSVPWLFMRRQDLLDMYDELDPDGAVHYRRVGPD